MTQKTIPSPTIEELVAFEPFVRGTKKPLRLSMQRLVLTGRVLPVGARLLVRHEFRCAEAQPIEVVYGFGLPRDAALRRFRIAAPGIAVRSELRPVREAEALYERGVEDGHLSVLARQYGDGLVNLSVGQLRPGDDVTVLLEILAGVEMHDTGFQFRFPFTLAPSYHPRARAVAVGEGEGEIELPADELGDVLLPRWTTKEEELHEVSFQLSVESEAKEIVSPSHALQVRWRDDRTWRVALAPESEVPNRDLVLEARWDEPREIVLAGRGSDGRGHFAVAVPSVSFGEADRAPQSVVFVLDRSGSMSGVPLAQAQKALRACLSALTPEDRFGLVAFDNVVERFRPGLVPATAEERRAAEAWLDGIDARGGTELAPALEEAADLLDEGGGEIVVLTDGQVFGTESVLARAARSGVRVHALGIGSASQDRFLALLARRTGGHSRFVTARTRIDREALELFAAVSRPVAAGVRCSLVGSGEARIEPAPPVRVDAGRPFFVFGECDGTGARLAVEWDGGRREIELAFTAGSLGEILRLLRGARLLTDRDADGLPDDDATALEALSRRFGLASRAMALVAVVERAGDEAGTTPLTRVVPVGLPQDMRFEGVFGDALWMAPPAAPARSPMDAAARMAHLVRPSCSPAVSASLADEVETFSASFADGLEALWIDRVAELEPDGGLPGDDDTERLLRTLLLVAGLAEAGSTIASGPFRRHLRRMLAFVEKGLPGPLGEDELRAARAIVDAIRRRDVPSRDDVETLERAAGRRGIEGSRL